jgi:hypothetical protein
MRHIYGLKYPNYDVNKNKVEIKTLHILLGLNGQAGLNNVNPPRSALFCGSLPSSCSYVVTYKIIKYTSFRGCDE